MRHSVLTNINSPINFNPRTHVGCDGLLAAFKSINAISIHAPTWGATPVSFSFPYRTVFQSTHPRGVRRALLAERFIRKNISIHAPTWGATEPPTCGRCGCRISIHAPTWGATGVDQAGREDRIDFNPRTHVGCDKRAKIGLKMRNYFNPRTHVGCDVRRCHEFRGRSISIHAPTWGATVKPSNGWLLGHKDNEFANENIIIINSVNIT